MGESRAKKVHNFVFQLFRFLNNHRRERKYTIKNNVSSNILIYKKIEKSILPDQEVFPKPTVGPFGKNFTS